METEKMDKPSKPYYAPALHNLILGSTCELGPNKQVISDLSLTILATLPVPARPLAEPPPAPTNIIPSQKPEKGLGRERCLWEELEYNGNTHPWQRKLLHREHHALTSRCAKAVDLNVYIFPIQI